MRRKRTELARSFSNGQWLVSETNAMLVYVMRSIGLSPHIRKPNRKHLTNPPRDDSLDA